MTRMAQVSPRRVLAAAVAVCSLTLVVGCTGVADDAPSTGPSGPATGIASPPGTAVTTPVAPPQPGDTSSTVATRAVGKRKPVGLAQPSQAEDGIRVSLTAVKAITATAQGPGEVAGPALAITVAIENTTSSEVSLLNAAVTLTASDGTPGSSMIAAPATPLPSTVGPGQTATGVAVFTVAQDKRNPVTVEVVVDPRTPTAVFRGKP